MYSPYLQKRTDAGLTFIELLVTVSITSLLMIVVVASTLMLYRSHTSSGDQSTHIRSLQDISSRIAKGIREATVAADGSYPLLHTGASALIFFSDIDGDGDVERVTYTLEGHTLTQTVVSPWGSPPTYTGIAATSIVSDKVRNNDEGIPLFRYFDFEGNEVLDASDSTAIGSVTITLVLSTHPTLSTHGVTLQSSATLRNLKSE